jgi:hypothetical protein
MRGDPLIVRVRLQGLPHGEIVERPLSAEEPYVKPDGETGSWRGQIPHNGFDEDLSPPVLDAATRASRAQPVRTDAR